MLNALPEIVFAIPLRAKSGSSDWEKISQNLENTVKSVLRQTYSNVSIIVCGHDIPAGLDTTRVTWISAEFQPPEAASKGSLDKAMKRKRILTYCKENKPNGIYLFCLDADDLIAPDLAKYIAEHHNKVGYFIDKGYVYDSSRKTLAEMTPPKRPFHRSCGSCAAFWLTHDDLPSSDGINSEYWNALRQHGKFPEVSASFGRILEPIPFHAALYIINHGTNLSVEQGVSEVQTNHAIHHNITDDTLRSQILKQFALSTSN